MCRFIFKRAQLTRLINTFTLAVKTFSTVIKVDSLSLNSVGSSVKRRSSIITIMSDNNCLYVASVKYELIWSVIACAGKNREFGNVFIIVPLNKFTRGNCLRFWEVLSILSLAFNELSEIHLVLF